MAFDKFKEDHDKLIKELGGYSAVNRRLNLQQIYFRLNFRAIRGVEHLDMVRGEQLLHFLYPVDFYTETGLSRLRIPPHSCIEYKERIVSDTIYRVNEFAKRHYQVYPGSKVYLLYQEEGDLVELAIREAKRIRLAEVYQVDDFLNRVERVAKTNERIDALERDWRNERELLIDNARVAFQEDHCSFFLGAGVSMDAGGPSWEDLLRRILKRFKKIGKQKDFEKVYKQCGNSPIILGRYAASNEKSLNDISEYLRRYILYRNINLDKSELVKAICEAVIGPNGDDERIVESNRIDSIITYNYDDLVETALEDRGVSVARISVKGRSTRTEFPVYHVHGLIPYDKRGIIATPILSEKEYHKIYKESYHWSNVEQLHALDRNTCFFIGLSMTDPNLRRLLDISQTNSDKECRHFAFLKRDPLFKPEDVEMNRHHFNTIEFQLSDLGVHVIWYENHSEVPDIIRRIIAPMRYMG